MQDRIRQIIAYSGKNQGEFAEHISVAAATISNIIKGKNRCTLEVIQRIRNAYPEINPIWLLDGVGEMLTSTADAAALSPDAGQDFLNPGNGGSSLPPMDLFSAPATPTGGNTIPATPAMQIPQSRQQAPVLPAGVSLAESPATGQIQMVKIIDKPLRRVREIQVFYDDDTYEVFVPRK